LLELFFLPPYSLDLNPIEDALEKDKAKHNRFFESLQSLCYDLKMYWTQFANPNDELMKLSHLFKIFVIESLTVLLTKWCRLPVAGNKTLRKQAWLLPLQKKLKSN